MIKIGGGILFLLLSLCASLEGRKRRGEGESRSPLEAEQATLRDCFGLRWAKKIAASVGGGTYCTRSTCIWILLSSLFASLEEREGAEGGESRSPLGAKQGTLRGMLRIEVG